MIRSADMARRSLVAAIKWLSINPALNVSTDEDVPDISVDLADLATAALLLRALFLPAACSTTVLVVEERLKV